MSGSTARHADCLSRACARLPGEHTAADKHGRKAAKYSVELSTLRLQAYLAISAHGVSQSQQLLLFSY